MTNNLLTRAREKLAREATEKRFATRLATEDQRNGYEVGWFEGYSAALAQPMGEEAVEAVARGVIAAWEVLPGQRRYATPEVQLWLNQHLTPAINDLRAALAAQPLPVSGDASPRDGRDPDPTKEGIFRDHRCWKCNDGEKPCVRKGGHSHLCEYPHARND